MKLLLLSALLAVALSQPIELSEQDLGEWELFKIEYEREYESDVEEMERRETFVKNLNFIREHNAKYERGESTYNMKMNHFGDKTHEEVRALRGFSHPEGSPRTGEAFDDSEDVELPTTQDWRKTGAVTGVKNQGTCGSCWAFSTTGSLEGQHFLKTKKLVSLSEENLVDCSFNEGNGGCLGGTMDAAFDYIINNEGIDTEKSYPYEAVMMRSFPCRYDSKKVGATVKGHVDITQYSESALQKAVAKVGPVSVAIDASQPSFTFYSSGVYNDPACSSTQLDHGVLAVGYGTAKKGGAYWLVKNSWGTAWGMKGYVMMKRNHKNQCGIATMASYPKV